MPAFQLERLEARRLLADAASVVIEPDVTRQTMDGFGAAMIWWTQRPEYQDPAFYDLIVNDLGSTIARGALWQSFEIMNDNDDPNVINWDNFNKEALRPVMSFFQQMQDRGAETFFLTVWTPPWWMKTNQAHKGGGSLRADMYEEYAEFVSAALQVAKNDYGVEIDAISIQNEPHFVTPYESTTYSPVDMREAARAVIRRLDADGIDGVKIMMPEDLGLAGRPGWYVEPSLNDPEVSAADLIIGTHWADNVGRSELQQMAREEGVPVWYTEFAGQWTDWPQARKMASLLWEGLVEADASAYVAWQFSDSYDNRSAALMIDGQPTNKYYAAKHFYKYVRPGMVRLETSKDNNQILPSAFRDPDTGEMTLVFINNNGSNTYSLSVDDFAGSPDQWRAWRSSGTEQWKSLGTMAGGDLTINLPPNAIVTLTSMPDDTKNYTTTPPQPYNIPWPWDSTTSNPVRAAAAAGDAPTISYWINDRGYNVNDPGPTGWTPLHHAAAGNFAKDSHDDGDVLEALQRLLYHGANVSARTDTNFTPLHVAAMNQNTQWPDYNKSVGQRIDALVAAGADVNARDEYGRTPLHWAALQWGIKIGYIANDTTAVQRLLAAGADASLRDNEGMLALDYAIQSEQPEKVSLLNFSGPPTVPNEPPPTNPPAPSDPNDPPPAATAPTVTDALMQDETEQRVIVEFSADVGQSIDVSDMAVVNRDTDVAVDASEMAVFWREAPTNRLVVKFPGILPDGRYRFTLMAAGVQTAAGGKLAQDVVVDFQVLGGDANRSGKVDLADFNILAANFGKQGNLTFSQGDFNYDNRIDIQDFNILATNFGRTLPGLAALHVVPKPPTKSVPYPIRFSSSVRANAFSAVNIGPIDTPLPPGPAGMPDDDDAPTRPSDDVLSGGG